MKKQNQRVRITKMIFQESLIKLMMKKSLSEITVTELCDSAELNRSTFYKYYGNVYDIIDEIKADIYEKIGKYISEINSSGETNAINMVYKILCYIQNNCELHKSLLKHNSDSIINIISFIVDYIIENTNLVLSEKSEYCVEYVIMGSLGIIKKWLYSENPKEPVEIAKMIYDFSVKLISDID
ncbi:MAG: TetR/AcrR family transcriptional regulator [Ruminococcus flavefaciens]|nr:TetR/AcrR family transcriptional regulator [Ruminococcus flavefaciens]